jgi:hypothetical protein
MATERITGFELLADRYVYDFKACTYAKGWAQIDTKQDAPYYGTWTNPQRREIFSYCEGDTTLVRCETDEEYVQEVRECASWNKGAGYWLGIDPGLGAEMRERFETLGLGDLLH